MTSRDFCYWLQGYLEISDASQASADRARIDSAQLDCIKKHLSMVFKHEIDPTFGDPGKQTILDALHNPQTLMRC